MSTASKAKILIIDDDVKVLRDAGAYLGKRGYTVEVAEDGHSGIAMAEKMSPDLVVLDISFPDERKEPRQAIDGIEVLRRLREMGDVCILMLSATNISSVKVMTLSIGADDYLQKPFEIQELGARIEAILRRSKSDLSKGGVLSYRRLRLDPAEKRVWKDGELVELTALEFELLFTIARRPEHVFTREKLLELAWSEPSYSIPKVVDVHIGHIRKKIEDDPENPSLIVTVRGVGYRFEDTPA